MKYTYTILLLIGFSVASRAEEPDEQLAKQLADVVRDVNASIWVRIEAAKTLGKLGNRGGPAVPSLTITLGKFRSNEFPTLQEEIVRALGRIGHPAKTALPA